MMISILVMCEIALLLLQKLLNKRKWLNSKILYTFDSVDLGIVV